jgi:fatty acid desaturase
MIGKTTENSHPISGSADGSREYRLIPTSANIAVLILQGLSLAACFWLLPYAYTPGRLLLLTIIFAITMNSVYAAIHEAHHRILFPNRTINDFFGIVLALFFPAPFHLLRQGHIGHHRHNRSDDEVFDLYFDRDSRLFKIAAWYGILTGFYWLLVVISNPILVLLPRLLRPSYYSWDHTAHVFLNHFDPKTIPLMRLEALLAILLHGCLIYFLGVPWQRYLFMYFGFGLMWSSLQYVHHYGTERNVLTGAKNLHLFELLDRIWLNHNWHLTHHIHPTIPWIYLPEVATAEESESRPLLPAYAAMWRGPQHAEERVKNSYSGEISRR